MAGVAGGAASPAKPGGAACSAGCGAAPALRQAVVGVVAHVDAGKSTLAEALLLEAGAIREAGRVDHGTAHLDTLGMERSRGITIKNKQVTLDYRGTRLMLIDTPGHTDFAAEAERALRVLDCAIFVVGANDGLQGHGQALWRLLRRYQVPTLVFVNKADLRGEDLPQALSDIVSDLGEQAIPVALEGLVSRPLTDGGVGGGSADAGELADAGGLADAGELADAGGLAGGAVGGLGGALPQDWFDPDSLENAAMQDEDALEEFLDTGGLTWGTIRRLVSQGLMFPVFAGSALRHEGVGTLLQGLQTLLAPREWPADFGAQVYGVSRDAKGERVAWLKVTGGVLRPRQEVQWRSAFGGSPAGLPGPGCDNLPEAAMGAGLPVGSGGGRGGSSPKIAQVRVYCGAKYELAEAVAAGQVCGVTGLPDVRPGDALGAQAPVEGYACEPIMSHSVSAPGVDPTVLHRALAALCEEDPLLRLDWDGDTQTCQLRLMGRVQQEIVVADLRDRFGLQVQFGPGAVMYRETITQPVRGVGHFEPLRHYAEVHLDVEPLPRGSGVRFGSVCGEDSLDRNWQRLILTNAQERAHKGVLVGAALTDVRITLVAGQAHAKHTVGGDFRQSTYRAIRNALMKAREQGACLLLEPWVAFELQVPEECVGRALADLSSLYASFGAPDVKQGRAVLTGRAPAVCLQDYGAKLAVYTAGRGLLLLEGAGYAPCHDDSVVEATSYDPRADLAHSPDSVFCSHGAGFTVPWNEVAEYAHVDAEEVSRRPWVEADAAFFSNGA